jgi:hypothetical protein
VSSPKYRIYSYNGQNEFCLSFGVEQSRQILIIPPLFDEMNRVRRMLTQAMRDLAARGVGSVLIDLPGSNESLARLEEQSLNGWRAAVAACAQQLGATHSAALRGGTLVDDGASLPHWRLAPVKGSALLKTMIRTRLAGDKEAGKTTSEAELMALAQRAPLELAGNMLGPDMIAQLSAAEPVPVTDRVERKLGEDITGSPLWLRAEPQDDATMSASIAEDLDRWSAACGG